MRMVWDDGRAAAGTQDRSVSVVVCVFTQVMVKEHCRHEQKNSITLNYSGNGNLSEISPQKWLKTQSKQVVEWENEEA